MEDLLKIKKKKLPKFIRKSLLFEKEDKYVYIPAYILEAGFPEEVKNMEDYKKLLKIVGYFGLEIPRTIEEFEIDPKNENLILQYLWSNYNDPFFKLYLDKFKNKVTFEFDVRIEDMIHIKLYVIEKCTTIELSIYYDKNIGFFSYLLNKLKKYSLKQKNIVLFKDYESIIDINNGDVHMILQPEIYSIDIRLKNNSDEKARFLKLLKKVCETLKEPIEHGELFFRG